MEISDSQRQELARLKSYFPYRIVWGAVNPATGEWKASANPTMRQANDHARKGWAVVVVKYNS